MQGIADYNFPAFRAAAADLRDQGYDVVSPAEMDESEGFDPTSANGAALDEDRLHELLSRDIELIASASVRGIVVLPGWTDSGGARLEVHTARSLGKPVHEYPSLKVLFESRRADRPESCPDVERVPYPPRREVCACRPNDDYYLRSCPTHGVLAELTGEQRIVDPTTGGAKGRKPQRMELLPWSALMRLSELYAAGAAKYDDHNWRRGYAWSLSFGAMMRHATLFWEGQDTDPETGQPHMASVAFHALALLHYLAEHPEGDDRPSSQPRTV